MGKGVNRGLRGGLFRKIVSVGLMAHPLDTKDKEPQNLHWSNSLGFVPRVKAVGLNIFYDSSFWSSQFPQSSPFSFAEFSHTASLVLSRSLSHRPCLSSIYLLHSSIALLFLFYFHYPLWLSDSFCASCGLKSKLLLSLLFLHFMSPGRLEYNGNTNSSGIKSGVKV